MTESQKKSPVAALAFGFLPAALALVIGTASGQDGPSRPVLWSVFAVSLGCCFTSSFLLFRRKTVWAIVGGIVFLLLNGFISLFIGCVAALKGIVR